MSIAQASIVRPAAHSAVFDSSAKVTRGIVLSGGLYGTVRHIGTSHERRGFDVMEAESARFLAELRELFRRVVAAHRMMISGRRQVLSHREDVDARLAQ